MNYELSDDLPGRRFGKDGRLLVQRRINEGGVGTVYEALDTKTERRLAMKFLKAEFAGTEETIARFKREGEQFAGLDHPNIVRVYGMGREHGYLYLACEFVEGRSLGHIVRHEAPLPPARALEIAKQVASALQAGHQRQIVHRDLKPDNIMIRDSDGQVMLLDFGIAKPMDSTSMLTRIGAYLGTPGYSAPEQVRGEEVDPRTDIFPLGVVLYEMLTGRYAFNGKNTREILAASVGSRPLSVLKANPAVGKPVARLIDRMLEKNPGKRFQSMAEVIAAIEAIDQPEAAASREGGGVVGRLKRFLSR